MKCQECGFELIGESKLMGFITEIVMKCPNCGWTAVTAEMADIADDLTKYNIVIASGNLVKKENMRMISKISGHNILETKKILTDGGVIISEYAVKIVEIITQLDIMNIKYHIEPEFPY